MSVPVPVWGGGGGGRGGGRQKVSELISAKNFLNILPWHRIF